MLGEATEAPFSFTMTDLGVGDYNISAEAVDAEGLRGYSNIINIKVQAPVVEVMYTDTPPTIDGEIDEVWENENITTIAATNVLVGADITPENLSGTAKILWDHENIFLLAIVTDDMKVKDSPNTYEDDNVEFYFDLNNAKSSSYNSDDVQYSFGWNDGTKVGVLPSGRSAEGIIYKISDQDNGYTVEAKIPWSTLGGTVENNKAIGFDFMINDDDDGGGRDGKLSWNATTDQAWQNASLFGTIRLVGGSDNPDPETPLSVNKLNDKDKNGVIVFPNPIDNILKLDGLSQKVDYEIINTSGRKIQVGQASDSINVEGLPKGVYILKIHGKAPQQVKFTKK